MAKKSKAVSAPREYFPKPTIYLNSREIKIPNTVKGKVGKTVSLSVRAKVVSQRLNREVGRKQTEAYDLEIQRIRPSSKRKK